MNTTKIIEEVSQEQFGEIISKYKGNISISPHALDHLSDSQRKIFNEKELILTLIRENPRGIGLQRNGRYACFFRRKHGYMKIILEIKDPKLEIITFMNTDTIPNLKRI